MVIKPAFRKFEGRGDVVHRGSVVTLLLKKASAVCRISWRESTAVSRVIAAMVTVRGVGCQPSLGDGVPGWCLGAVVFNSRSSRRAFKSTLLWVKSCPFGLKLIRTGCGETGETYMHWPRED